MVVQNGVHSLFCTLSNINEIQDRRGFEQKKNKETLFYMVGNRSQSGEGFPVVRIPELPRCTRAGELLSHDGGYERKAELGGSIPPLLSQRSGTDAPVGQHQQRTKPWPSG